MSRGIQRERDLVNLLRSQDWYATRSPASKGDADVIALKKGCRPRLIEVKSTSAGPFHSFGPKDRADLLFAADLAGADAFLVWWPPRGKPVWLSPDEWPK